MPTIGINIMPTDKDEFFYYTLIDLKSAVDEWGDDVFSELEKSIYKANIRKIKEKWHFNTFKNLVIDNQVDFIQGGEGGTPYDIISSNISSPNTDLKPFYKNE